MSDYTPSIQELARAYEAVFVEARRPEARAEAARAIAAHDAEKRAEWEAEQGDKPAPCVMTHTPPFDFAQCETHDETFPLGGACKWHGKESVAQVLQDEADEQRMRAVRAEHQLEILRAEQCETEWEGIVLGREVGGSGDWSATVWRPDEIEEARAMFPGSEYVLGRAKWMPVPDTTNESEDE